MQNRYLTKSTKQKISEHKKLEKESQSLLSHCRVRRIPAVCDTKVSWKCVLNMDYTHLQMCATQLISRQLLSSSSTLLSTVCVCFLT